LHWGRPTRPPRSPTPSRWQAAGSPPSTAGGGMGRVSYRRRLARCGRPAHAPIAAKGPGMRVLLTGGTGYVGSHTVAALVEGGHQVRLLVRAVQRVALAVAPLGPAGRRPGHGGGRCHQPSRVHSCLTACSDHASPATVGDRGGTRLRRVLLRWQAPQPWRSRPGATVAEAVDPYVSGYATLRRPPAYLLTGREDRSPWSCP
jgi:hypothetical protein